MERLARDNTAVIAYRLMRMLATRFSTSCSSTMVWGQRFGVVTNDVFPSLYLGSEACLELSALNITFSKTPHRH